MQTIVKEKLISNISEIEFDTEIRKPEGKTLLFKHGFGKKLVVGSPCTIPS